MKSTEEGRTVSRENEEEDEAQHRPHLYDRVSIFFFFCGSIFYVVTGVWDVVAQLRANSQISESGGDNDSGDDDEWSDSLLDISVFSWDLYDALSFTGPFLYLLNGLNDLRVALKSESQYRTLEIRVASLFAVAAMFDILAVLVYSTNTPVYSYMCYSAAVHCYMLFAIVALRDRSYTHYKNWALVFLGDFLFLIGSLMDAVTSYFCYPGSNPDWTIIESWYLVSAILWFVCAVFYVVTDIVERSATVTDYSRVVSHNHNHDDAEESFDNELTRPEIEDTILH